MLVAPPTSTLSVETRERQRPTSSVKASQIPDTKPESFICIPRARGQTTTRTVLCACKTPEYYLLPGLLRWIFVGGMFSQCLRHSRSFHSLSTWPSRLLVMHSQPFTRYILLESSFQVKWESLKCLEVPQSFNIFKSLRTCVGMREAPWSTLSVFALWEQV